MPEYSSTTLTPTNETKVPAMQNNNSGNFQLDALKTYILAEKAQANGLASLDATGKLVSSQIPDNLDDVLVYGSYALLPATGVEGKIYITADTNSMYRWDASLETPDYVMLAVDLEEYATKAELQAETNQRKASDSRLESRLENLEQKAGDYTTVQYRGTNAVPTGKAKNGLVEKIVGKSRAWNQLCDIPSSSASYSGNGITFTDNRDGSYTLQTDANGATADTNIPIIPINITQGKVILLGGAPSNSSITTHRMLFSSVGTNTYMSNGDNIYTIAGDTTRLFLQVFAGDVVTTPITFKPFIRDLNIIFQEYTTAQIVTLGMAGVFSIIPSLGQYNPYDAGSLVDTEVSGVESVGVNIWDEVKNEGKAIGDTGTAIIQYASSGLFCPTNPIPCQPNTTYKFIYSKPQSVSKPWLYELTSEGTDSWSGFTIAQYVDSGYYFTTSANAKYITFSCFDGTTNIQLCDNTLPDSIKTVYHPYKTDTLSLPETVTLRSAGSVAEEYYPETGRVTHPLYRVNLGNLTYEKQNYGSGEHLFRAILPSGRYYKFVDNDQIANMICSRYVPNTYYNLYDTAVKGISYGYNAGRVIIIADSNYSLDSTGEAQLKADLANVYLDYEQENPDPDTYVDPILDPFIQVEGGGTVETIQTQSPVIDNCLDVGYLTL